MNDDPWRDPNMKLWVQNVLDDMVPKMEGSACVMSLVPGNREADVKFWVELGASIMMDKPILAIVLDEEPIPPKLEMIADEIVRLPEGANLESSEVLAAAVQRMMAGTK